jgi:LCP family protein required for cell wall assembly
MPRGAHAESRRQRRARLRRERRAHERQGPGGPADVSVAVGPGAVHDEEGHERGDAHVEQEGALHDDPGVDAEEAPVAAPRTWSAPVAPSARTGGRRLALLVGLVLALLGGALTYLLLDEPPGAETAARGPLPERAGPEQDTLLLVRRSEEGGPAEGLTLLAAGPEEGTGLVLFLPVGTLVDIPGVGLDRLGLTHQYGGPALTQAAVENMLGIQIDHAATVSDAGLASLLERAGGVTVEVPSRLVRRADDGTAEVRFEPGEQVLDGRRLAEYWGFVARGEDELASFSRQQAVLQALLERAGDPDQLDVIAGDGAPQLDTAAEPDWIREQLAALAAAHGQNELRVTLLPVESFGGDGPDGGATFRPRREGMEALVSESLAASVPADGVGGPVRVQVLNGVGLPGVGQHVDRKLGGGSFRIVLTDNARSFDFTETRILVYDESTRSMEAARRVQERLGVGTIQVSRQPQSVVDVTIVVGSDFLEAQGITPDVEEEQTEDG